MSRSLSATAQAAAFAATTSEAFLVLLEIDHDDFSAPVRVVNNNEDIVSNGNTYTAYPFQLTPPAEKEGKVTNAQLTIDNISRELTAAFRGLTSPASAQMSIVLGDSPDTVELGPLSFTIEQIKYTSTTIQAELIYDDRLNIEVPGLEFTPAKFPGLF